MNRFLLLLCLAFVLLGGSSANIDEDNTTQAQAACTALLTNCQLLCGTHGGPNGATNCVIDNDGNVKLSCVCSDGYTPPIATNSAVTPQV
jgi:hypothetical protein